MKPLKKTKRFPKSLMEDAVDNDVLDVLSVRLDLGELEALLLLVRLSKTPDHEEVEIELGSCKPDSPPYFESV